MSVEMKVFYCQRLNLSSKKTAAPELSTEYTLKSQPRGRLRRNDHKFKASFDLISKLTKNEK